MENEDTSTLDVTALTGARILVSGGHGFIGGRLCRRLSRLGCQVLAVSRSVMPNVDGVQSRVLDLTDMAAVQSLFQEFRPDFVLHLASHVAGNRDADFVLSTYHNNLTSTVHLLLAAHAAGCRRVVLTGSLEEPELGPQWPVPSSPYAAAKFAASAYGRMFHALYGLSVVMLRLFMVYGPGQKDLRKLVPYVITSLQRGETPHFSSGVREVDWVYVDDVVEAYLHAMTRPGVDGETIDVGTGQLTTVRKVVEMLFTIMGRTDLPTFGGIGDRAMEQVRCANVEKSAALLGWTPSVSLIDGLRRSAAAYKNELR